jgi:hypothetical protein
VITIQTIFRAAAAMTSALVQPRLPYPPPIGLKGRARIGLITVIEEEFTAAQQVFQVHTNIPGTPYFAESNPASRDWDLILTQATDRTNVPFSGEVSNLIQDLRPQVLVLLGVAGGLCDGRGLGRDGIDLGHVLIADYVGYVEFLKITDKGTFHRHYAIDHPSLPLKRSASIPLQKDFDLQSALTLQIPAMPLNPPRVIIPRVHIGPIVSAEKVMGDVHDPVQQKLISVFLIFTL